ncbi:hypothetical protein CERSUDRAFT_73743 [Gelatoporia subvermispora B]|uniref:Ubiquitin-like protease family profile domain-containing protein n=1 Tax=Ceriporiopsis subvermispora (strain B) TaxID=914234 RepID=M2QI10_CERS8|nr:hypothetical protein CERSUDRAFT_73743 [Gelatoporia subvermispora B]
MAAEVFMKSYERRESSALARGIQWMYIKTETIIGYPQTGTRSVVQYAFGGDTDWVQVCRSGDNCLLGAGKKRSQGPNADRKNRVRLERLVSGNGSESRGAGCAGGGDTAQSARSHASSATSVRTSYAYLSVGPPAASDQYLFAVHKTMTPSLRDQQPFVPGAGRLFYSPKKKRLSNVNKAVVHDPARILEIQRLRKRLEELENPPASSQTCDDRDDGSADIQMGTTSVDDPGDGLHEQDGLADSSSRLDDTNSEPPDTLELERKRRRTTHTADIASMHSRWKTILPTIPVATHFAPNYRCTGSQCSQKKQDVTILFWDHYENHSVPYCQCTPLPHVLITSGMFPTSPSQPRIAVSIDLLEFYFALFECSGDAVTALARAMRNYYTRRGWHVLDSKGVPILDPFCRPLGFAIQWYDSVCVLIARTLDGAIEKARQMVAAQEGANSSPLPSRPSDVSTPSQLPNTPPLDLSDETTTLLSDRPLPATSSPMTLLSPPSPSHNTRKPSVRQCSSFLQCRCPACFGGSNWGRSLAAGGDIVVAVDGNFSHRHLQTSGEGLEFYEPEYFVPKEKVDSVGTRIEQLRQAGKKPKSTYVPKVPDEAVNACEQLKYAICLVEELFANIPDDAIVAVLYDIGCVADRGNSLYSYLPDHITGRLVWAISIMHAYGHQWACLRDGEGVERLWARLRVFISITQTSGRTRRIWLIDRQVQVIAKEMRNNLGLFLVHKLTHGVTEQRGKARPILDGIAVNEDELREQAAQLSVRAHAPARLKKEVDAVLALQNDFDRVEAALQAVRTQLSDGEPSEQASVILSTLEKTSKDLSKRVDNLYTSLNVGTSFPELKGLDTNFVKILILARDIKCNIRKRVTAQFLEYDRLDRAAGGKDNPLGTKLHQHTRKAISKRQPSILTAIRKFNRYCLVLAEEAKKYDVPSTFPIPSQLSTDLAKLRDDPNLYDDVWPSPLPHQGTERPRWLEEQSVREGIQAVLKIDRCNEEEARLRREAQNMCAWFGRELAATKLALLTFGNALYAPLLQQRHDDVALLQRRWDISLLPPGSLKSQVSWASGVVRQVLQRANFSQHLSINSTSILTPLATFDEEEMEDLIENLGDNPQMIDILEEIISAKDEEAQIATPAVAFVTAAEDNSRDASHSRMQTCKNNSYLTPQGYSDDDGSFSGTGSGGNDVLVLAPKPEDKEKHSVPQPSSDDVQYVWQCPFSCSNISPVSAVKIVLYFQLITSSLLLENMQVHNLYWERDCWLIPVHHEPTDDQVGHWTLVIAIISKRQFYHFDSLTMRSAWIDDIKVVSCAHCLIRRVFELAGCEPPPGAWHAMPLITSPVQRNGVDCGVWVLAVIAARVRGFDLTGLTEKDLPFFRTYLCGLISQLPEQ